jgi:hypothetical protein
MRTAQVAIALTAAVAVLYVDVGLLVFFAQSDILLKATGLELLFFFAQFVKLAVVLAFKRLRYASTALMVDVYGAEMLLLPVILASYVAFHPAGLLEATNQMVQGWIVGVAVTGLLYSAFRLVRGMMRSDRLTTVLPLGLVSVELGVLLTEGTETASKAHSGLRGVAVSAFLQGGGTSAASPWLFGAVGVVYVSLLLYALVGWDLEQMTDRNRALLLGAAATLASAALVYFLPSLPLAIDFVLVPPTLAVMASSWWITRGK